MKTRIHINQHKLRRCEPDAVAARTYRGSRYGSEVRIKDVAGNVVATVVCRPDNPLPCGARAWVETEYEVEVV